MVGEVVGRVVQDHLVGELVGASLRGESYDEGSCGTVEDQAKEHEKEHRKVNKIFVQYNFCLYNWFYINRHVKFNLNYMNYI